MFYEQPEDYRPLFWIQGRPVHATTLIVALHVISFIVSGICISYFGFAEVYKNLSLSPSLVWSGEVWRLFSYVAFDPRFFIERSIWFLFAIVLFYFFGREVELFVGRANYLKLYAALVLIPAALYSLLNFVGVSTPYLNCCDMFFGFFVAFATIYPGFIPPTMLLHFTARTFMWIFLALFSLIDLAGHDYPAIFMLWTCSLVGYAAMRLVGAGSGLEWFTNWLDDRRTARLTRERNFKIVREQKANESIDAILDKISKQGVNSLNAQERSALERARAKLLERDER